MPQDMVKKGVVGILAKAEDLPYTADGISPDVLINPHAFPSRMTVGMMMESITGKAAAIRGKKVDASAFVGEKMDDVKDVMENAGFEYSGKEIMYDGKTGKQFPVEVFIGVVIIKNYIIWLQIRYMHVHVDKFRC